MKRIDKAKSKNGLLYINLVSKYSHYSTRDSEGKTMAARIEEKFAEFKNKSKEEIFSDNSQCAEPGALMKAGDIIIFNSGYNDDIRYTAKVLGFDWEGKAYILWDCYWSPVGLKLKQRNTVAVKTEGIKRSILKTFRRMSQRMSGNGWNEIFTAQEWQIKIIRKLYEANGLSIFGGSACPEQYDIIKDGSKIAHLHLRHGEFTVEYPYDGKEIAFFSTAGDGAFDSSERLTLLTKAMRKILLNLNRLSQQ